MIGAGNMMAMGREDVFQALYVTWASFYAKPLPKPIFALDPFRSLFPATGNNCPTCR